MSAVAAGAQMSSVLAAGLVRPVPVGITIAWLGEQYVSSGNEGNDNTRSDYRRDLERYAYPFFFRVSYRRRLEAGWRAHGVLAFRESRSRKSPSGSRRAPEPKVCDHRRASLFPEMAPDLSAARNARPVLRGNRSERPPLTPVNFTCPGSPDAGFRRNRRPGAGVQPDLDQTLRQVTLTATQVLPGCTAASISMVQKDGSLLTLGATDELAVRGDQIQYDEGEGPCVDAAMTQRWVYTPDTVATSGGHGPAGGWPRARRRQPAVVPAVDGRHPRAHPGWDQPVLHQPGRLR